MNSFMRLLTGIALAGAALTALNNTCPEWVRQIGLDFWKLPELWQECHDGSRRLAGQDDQKVAVLGRVGVRSKIVESVADGSMSLFEAASAFREINRGAGAVVPVHIRELFPVCSEEECLCRQVIIWTESDLRAKGESDRASEVVTRLQAILGQCRLEGTPLVLPPCQKP